MDSRTMEALEAKAFDTIIRCRPARVIMYEDAIALLTAEPEPCEDARELVKRIISIAFPDQITTVKTKDFNAAVKAIQPYASQVADKREEELRAQVETLRAQLLDAQECMAERRGYCEAWEWKYKDRWNREDNLINEALAATDPKP